MSGARRTRVRGENKDSMVLVVIGHVVQDFRWKRKAEGGEKVSCRYVKRGESRELRRKFFLQV